MQYPLSPPLRPRNGHTLQVLGVDRISTINQDERSLGDQGALGRRWVKLHYGSPFNLRTIASQGSGERLDRAESFELAEAVESRKYDLVITEDLGRIFRRMHAYTFCEHCEDHGTRLIAINDHVDTAQGNWRLAAIFGAMKHEASNKDTSERIKRTLRNRFEQGGVFQTVIYGYIKPRGAKSDADILKDPASEKVYDEWFRRLEQGASYAEIADWLNATGVPVGPYCRDKKWSGRMVRRVTFNHILKGERQRNNKVTIRVNKTGRHKTIDAPPEEHLSRYCRHLAFIEPERYDRVIRLLRLRNQRYRRGSGTGSDSRTNLPKKRTAWPGQHILCGICGRPYYWGGHGQTEHMMCSGARDYVCWNGATFDGKQAGRILCKAVLVEIEQLPDFDRVFMNKVRAQFDRHHHHVDEQMATLAKELTAVKTQSERALNLIVGTEDEGVVLKLRGKLAQLQAQENELLFRRDNLQHHLPIQVPLPSIDEIKRIAREIVEHVAETNPDFGRRMRQIVPSLHVYPCRLCDGGRVVLRASLILDLGPLVGISTGVNDLEKHLRRVITVDLFDLPQRAEHRREVIKLRAAGMNEANVACKLGLTVTATQRAAFLQRLMDERGLTDPYVPVTEPPVDCTKLQRHLHHRYHFEPMPGYPNW